MADVYEGGIPSGGFATNLSTQGSQALSQPTAGPSEEGYSKGGPAMSQGATTTDFLDDSSYQTGSLSIDDEPTMKVINPDDLQTK